MDASAAHRTPASVGLPRLIAALRVFHPFPTILNTTATIGLAAIALGAMPPARDVAVLASAMFCIQAAIGASNDYVDRDLDAMTKPYKPIVRGLLAPQAALALAAILAICSGALTATLGLLPVLVGVTGALAGFSYNWRLKRTVFSAVPLMVALPALPIWIWVSLDVFSRDLFWLFLFGPPIGLAVHLSNAAPDVESDRSAGVAGLAQRLGAERSAALAWGAFGGALCLAAILGLSLHIDWQILAPGLLISAGLLACAVGAFAVRRTEQSLQAGFGLISIATAVIAGSWLAAS